jgi:crotonobetainyl-CoA:carnitine CoA-transferase CaiB-like acyl-CoA transferase
MPATQFGDLAGGSFLAVIGILSAMLGRGQTGHGQLVDVSMTEGVMALLPLMAALYLNTGQTPEPGQSTLDGALPCYNIYETLDGQYVTLAALEWKFWQTFCIRIGHAELLPLQQPANQQERVQAISVLRALFKTRTRAEWLTDLAEIDACVGPVYTLDEALNDPQALDRGNSLVSQPLEPNGETVRTLPTFPRLSDAEPVQRYAPPTPGEHTDELLRELGYSDAEIEQLKGKQIV